MRIHTIIHASFEKPGIIDQWILDNNHHGTITHIYDGEKLPDVSQFDFLVVMGGPQSPLKLDKYPYLRDEITLTQQAIKNNKPVLGICLGAQIIAESLGAKTERSPHKEIGLYPVEVTKEGETDPLFKQFPKQFEVMHWHNDMPGIPDKGVLLAKSEGCPRQAFRYGDRVYGFQFHLEMTPALIEGMLQHCPGDLQQGKYIRTSSELLSSSLKSVNQKMITTLDYLADKIGKK